MIHGASVHCAQLKHWAGDGPESKSCPGCVSLAGGCSEEVTKTPTDIQSNSPCTATEPQKPSLHRLLPLAFPSSLFLLADFLMHIRAQANLDAVIRALLCFSLTVGIICAMIFSSLLLPTSCTGLLHHRYQYISQTTKLTVTSYPLVSWFCQPIHTSASQVLHIWEAIAETRTSACWSKLQNVSGNTVPLLHKML